MDSTEEECRLTEKGKERTQGRRWREERKEITKWKKGKRR
jgi:hypothetical protein